MRFDNSFLFNNKFGQVKYCKLLCPYYYVLFANCLFNFEKKQWTVGRIHQTFWGQCQTLFSSNKKSVFLFQPDFLFHKKYLIKQSSSVQTSIKSSWANYLYQSLIPVRFIFGVSIYQYHQITTKNVCENKY